MEMSVEVVKDSEFVYLMMELTQLLWHVLWSELFSTRLISASSSDDDELRIDHHQHPPSIE